MSNSMPKVCTALAIGLFVVACNERQASTPATSTPAASAASPASTSPAEVTIPDGTPLALELQTAVASNTSNLEDPVEATVAEPVMVNGVNAVPAGSVVRGQVSRAKPSGKVQGRASVSLHFDTLVVGNDRYPIVAGFTQTATPQKTKDAGTIAGGAAGGAIIGAIVGGKKGAAIGTAIGGGTGAAVVLATSGNEVRLPAGTRLNLRLHKSVDVRLR